VFFRAADRDISPNKLFPNKLILEGGNRMKLKDAEKLAEQIMEQIRPFCDRLVVAGSIRRKKSEVRDVDLFLFQNHYCGIE